MSILDLRALNLQQKTVSRPVKEYVVELLGIVGKMQRDYPKKKFTLDGRLVGDIGEILAEQIYDLELLAGIQKRHDAISSGRYVQIKTTMKRALGFGDIPDFYLGIRVDEDGAVEELFNGPGSLIWEAIKHRKRPKNYLYTIPIIQLKELNKLVQEIDRIPKRKYTSPEGLITSQIE